MRHLGRQPFVCLIVEPQAAIRNVTGDELQPLIPGGCLAGRRHHPRLDKGDDFELPLLLEQLPDEPLADEARVTGEQSERHQRSERTCPVSGPAAVAAIGPLVDRPRPRGARA